MKQHFFKSGLFTGGGTLNALTGDLSVILEMAGWAYLSLS